MYREAHSRVTTWQHSVVDMVTSWFINEKQQQASNLKKRTEGVAAQRSTRTRHTQPKQRRSAELKRVQAASNGKDNDKQGQEERYYETIK